MVQFHEPQEGRSAVTERKRLQTISMFARAVGLSPSALRQYDESGLIAPAAVEERTGYRYYGLDQQQRAIWVRRLRDAGLPLERIRSVLEGGSAEAEAILDDWLADAEQRSTTIAALVDDVRSSLRAHRIRTPQQRTSVRFDASVISAALRQLAPATVTSVREAERDGVLIETRPDSVGVVSTDRYILLTRTDVPAAVDGPPARVHLSAPAVVDWLSQRQQVELIVEVPVGRDEQQRGARARFRDPQGEEIALPQETDRFPDVHRIIDRIEPSHGRVLFARDEVLRLAADPDSHGILLASGDRSGHLTRGDRVASGHGTGPFPPLELSGPAMLRIAQATVGDELTCDVSGPAQPLVWRAPSQPDFVALMMPRAA